MSDQEKYASKIRDILNHAERAGTQEEADSFFAKAQDLMTKWAIDDAMIQQAAQKHEKEQIEKRQIVLQFRFYKADASILQAIAINNQARVLITQQKGEGRGEYIAYLVGFPTDLDRTEMMFASMMIQLSRALEDHLRNHPEIKADRNANKTERKSFRYGFASRLDARLQEAKKVASSDGTANPYALALRNRDQEVDDYLAQMGAGKARGGPKKSSASGYMAGASAADRADVGNPAVGGNRKALRG